MNVLEERDGMIRAGFSATYIAKVLQIGERGVRRRRAELEANRADARRKNEE